MNETELNDLRKISQKKYTLKTNNQNLIKNADHKFSSEIECVIRKL